VEKGTLEVALEDLNEGIQAVWNRFGWVQHELGSESEGYCLIGAWRKATGMSVAGTHEDLLTTMFRMSVGRSVQELFPKDWFSTVEGFNDREGRSEEDIRLLAKHAIHSMGDFIPVAREARHPFHG
jgi:hypothetical protein